jgi:NADH-quinone oxidoreductase subunit M
MGDFNAKWEGHMPEISARELVTVVPLLALTVTLGIFPSLALRFMDTTIANLVRLIAG